MITLKDHTYNIPAIFVFTEDMMIQALEANGWNTLWHEDNWVHKNMTDPDHGGVGIEDAFKILLRKCNLI